MEVALLSIKAIQVGLLKAQAQGQVGGTER